MSLQTREINSVKITFDKEMTMAHRTDFNAPCDCQHCRNYYKHIENNFELVEFLSDFGIDYNCAEEVFSCDLGNDKDSLISYEGYYGVFGKIEGEEFGFEKYGVKITFAKGATVPCDRIGEYFWICVEADFPHILGEERESLIPFNYNEYGGTLIKKYRNIFGKYVFLIRENDRNSKVYVGKSIYGEIEVGSKLTVGAVKRKLINIRPGIL